MNIIDLFSGYGSWTKLYGYKDNIISVDNNKFFNANISQDILEWDYTNLEKNIDVIYASPPCNLYFTKLKTRYGIKIFTENDVILSKQLVDKVIEIINFFKPRYYVIENPIGKMQIIYPFIFNKIYDIVDYCMYGFNYKKSTAIWTNVDIEFKRCSHLYHSGNVQDLANSKERGKIPLGLVSSIYNKVMES